MAGKNHEFQDLGFYQDHKHFGSMKASASSASLSVSDAFTSSIGSASSADLTDDATSSSASSSASSSKSGPLFELSDLMAQLPIKRGLSKFYNGKSQTFGSLASVKSLEDLAKKETTSYNQRMKSCKSYGGHLNGHKFGPKATIRKRSPPVTLKRTISFHFKC